MIQINGTNEQKYQINCETDNICIIRCLSSQSCTNLVLYCAGVCYVECDVNGGDIDCPVNYGYTFTYSAGNQSTIDSDYGSASNNNNNNNSDNNTRSLEATVNIVIVVCVTVIILACVSCLVFLTVYNLKHILNDDISVDENEKLVKKRLKDIQQQMAIHLGHGKKKQENADTKKQGSQKNGDDKEKQIKERDNNNDHKNINNHGLGARNVKLEAEPALPQSLRLSEVINVYSDDDDKDNESMYHYNGQEGGHDNIAHVSTP